MPKTESELYNKVYELNISRSHHRSLYGEYSYNQILGVDLLKECLEQISVKKRKIRLLDIGCGDGYALSQLKKELKKKGLDKQVAIFGMGLNEYEPMYISKRNFLKGGLYQYNFGKRKQFDLVISVYTFHYLWHKLEGIEKIFNSLLAEDGKAFIHLPGYLILFSDNSSDLLLNEELGNLAFKSFIERWKSQNNNPPVDFVLTDYCNNHDEDDPLLTEFGVLHLKKNKVKEISFDIILNSFSIFDQGFIFDHIVSGLSYVSSIYRFRSDKKDKNFKLPTLDELPIGEDSSLSRVMSIKKRYGDRFYHLHLSIHCLEHPVIIGIYPGARDELSGQAIPYWEIATTLVKQRVGAVVRSNGPYGPGDDFHEFNDLFIHTFVDYLIDNAKGICGYAHPSIYLMGYSSGGSAIASIANEYPQITKILLFAPSFDSDRERSKYSLNRYTGELYIISGKQDEIISPELVAWFYYQAHAAKVREYLVLDNCNHAFEGTVNQDLVMKSPYWAFTHSSDFPAEDLRFQAE